MTWNAGCRKICVKAPKTEDLVAAYKKAKELGLPCHLVRDAGHTQVAPGSITVCGMGPATGKHLDLISGKLKLL